MEITIACDSAGVPRMRHRGARCHDRAEAKEVQRGSGGTAAPPPASVELFRALDLASGSAPAPRRPPSAADKDRAHWNDSLLTALKRLDWDVRARLYEAMPTQSHLDLVQACMDELNANIPKDQLDRWRIQMFGSAANGFGVADSDIDVVALYAAREEEQRPEAEKLLRTVWRPALGEHPRFSVVEEILSAKVPILKVQFDDRLDLDLSCQNAGALRNTRLLKAYANMHPRVKELGIAVKLWAKEAGVCGAQKRHLSSYTFTLLTLYFLQVNADTQLPCLPVDAFNDGAGGEDDPRVQSMCGSWTCAKSVADLLVSFFLWFTYSFAWGAEVVSIRLGQRHHAQEKCFEKLRGRWVWRLHVEDPCELDRNLHCVLGEDEEVRLRTAMAAAVQSLQCAQAPVGLRPLKCARPPELESPPSMSQVVKNQDPNTTSRRVGRLDSCNIGTDSTLSGGTGFDIGSSDLDVDDLRGQCQSGDEQESSAAAWLRRGLKERLLETAAANNAAAAPKAVVDESPPPFQWWRHLDSPAVAAAAASMGHASRQAATGNAPSVEQAQQSVTRPPVVQWRSFEELVCQGTALATLTPSGKASSKALTSTTSTDLGASLADHVSDDDDDHLGGIDWSSASPEQRAQWDILYGSGPRPAEEISNFDAKEPLVLQANVLDQLGGFRAKSTPTIAERVKGICKTGSPPTTA